MWINPLITQKPFWVLPPQAAKRFLRPPNTVAELAEARRQKCGGQNKK
jgi:hypothetical protein